MSQMLKSPARYVQGKGVLKELDRYLKGLGNHLMILQTAGGMRRNKSMLDNCFQGKEFIVDYEAFSGECTRAKIEAWAAQCRRDGVTAVIGIGGGKVLDPRPLRHKRHDPVVLDNLVLREQGSGSQRLLQAAEEFGVSLPDSSQLAERSGLDTGTAVSLLADLLNQGMLAEPLSGRYAAASALDTLWDRCRELLSAYHQKHPLHAGMPAAELRQKLFRQITPVEGDALLEVFRAEGRMKRAENRWALAEFSIRLTKRQTALRDALLERFLRGGPEPDTIEAVLDSIPPERREEARQVLESLLTGGELVRLAPELCWHREVFQKGLDILRTLCADHGAVTLAEVRDAFDTTRKYALLFLEACDRRQITVREGDCRRLKLKFHD